MDVPKALAATLALNRIAFGLGYLVRPEQARTSWIGRAARKPGAQVMIRSQGARDVALGAGALRALARGEDRELRAWATAHAVCDMVDLVVTWTARNDSPSAGRGWRWESQEHRPWSAPPRRWAWAPGSPDARGGTRTHTPLRTIGLKPIASRQFRHPGSDRS
jgi:hypothetical protein